jgi:hypothetical protein
MGCLEFGVASSMFNFELPFLHILNSLLFDQEVNALSSRSVLRFGLPISIHIHLLVLLVLMLLKRQVTLKIVRHSSLNVNQLILRSLKRILFFLELDTGLV